MVWAHVPDDLGFTQLACYQAKFCGYGARLLLMRIAVLCFAGISFARLGHVASKLYAFCGIHKDIYANKDSVNAGALSLTPEYDGCS